MKQLTNYLGLVIGYEGFLDIADPYVDFLWVPTV
jgi:hypothetical protein